MSEGDGVGIGEEMYHCALVDEAHNRVERIGAIQGQTPTGNAQGIPRELGISVKLSRRVTYSLMKRCRTRQG